MHNTEYKDKLTGVYAPIVTPFDEKGNVAWEALQRNLEKMNRTPLKGYFVLGTNGEFRSLGFDEKVRIVEMVLSLKQDKVIIVGASCESTIETIKTARELAALPMDFISLLPPSFFAKRMTDDALYGYFSEVADNVAKPILLYNNPAMANNVTLSSALISRVSRHPNIFGLKDTSKGNYDAYITASLGENFYVLSGSADFCFPAMLLGAVGGVLSLANVFPEICYRLFELGRARDLNQGLDFHREIVKLNSLVSGKYGVSGVKAAMDIFGFEGMYPRKPLSGLHSTQREELEKEVRKVLAELGI
ncbi:MAG TPA: dihydrodipicolinate synthase family protein [Atribacteraceae bacterium]|nr:dihydrodipicolinate synthase family protein [Atribacteraceae bacterium]